MPIGLPDRRIWRGQVVFDLLMQLRKPVVRDHREHVMFDMVVHVPIDKAADPVHQNRACVQPIYLPQHELSRRTSHVHDGALLSSAQAPRTHKARYAGARTVNLCGFQEADTGACPTIELQRCGNNPCIAGRGGALS